MIRKTLLVVAVLAIGSIVAAPAHAGGSSGAKKTVTMRVKNNLVDLANVGVLPNAATSGLTPASTLDQYRAAGGQFIAGNAVGSFKVAPGNGTMSALDPVGLVEADQCNYVATAGRIGYLTVDGADLENATISPSITKF